MSFELYEKKYDDFYKGEVTQELLQKVQDELKVKLPVSYVSLLTARNGFRLKKKYFPTDLPNSWANNSVYVDYLFGLGEDPGLLDNYYLREEWGIRSQKLVIISAEPPMFICLDYRRKKNPSVVFIDVEQKQEISLAKNFELFINGLQEEIEETEIENEDLLPDQGYYNQIDQVMTNGKPKDIDRLFTKILSTNKELIRYMVDKMRHHPHSKVHFYLLLYLSCCAEGDNKGTIEDSYLIETINEMTTSKNKDVRGLALYSLEELKKRVTI
jgi:hypothetical protein